MRTGWSSILFVLIICGEWNNAFSTESVTEWRQNIQKGDILYDTKGFAILGSPIKTGHVGIYAGTIEYGGITWPNQVIEATITGDTYHIGINTWDYPNVEKVFILRPDTTDEVKQRAVEFAIDQIGKRYSTNYTNKSADRDNDRWYCSELVWAAYFQNGNGINLADDPSESKVVTPRDILDDDDLTAIDFHEVLDPLPNDGYPVRNITQRVIYTTIQDALDGANEGDVIELEPGGYTETVTIDTPGVVLRAREYDKARKIARTVIRSVKVGGDQITPGADRPTVIEVNAPNVTLEGLTVTGASGEINRTGRRNIPRSGILVNEDAASVTVRDCITIFNPIGISIDKVVDPVVEKNTIAQNKNGIAMFIPTNRTEIRQNLFLKNSEYDLIATDDPGACAARHIIETHTGTGSDSQQRSLYHLRDNHLPNRMVEMYQRSSHDLISILTTDPLLGKRLYGLLSDFTPAFASLRQNRTSAREITQKDVAETLEVLRDIRKDAENKEKHELLTLLALLEPHVEAAAGKTVGGALTELKRDASLKPAPIKAGIKKTEPAVYVYLNWFMGNTDTWVDLDNTTLQWYSPEEITYGYRGRQFTGFVGNWWQGKKVNDKNNDGINDDDEEYSLAVDPSYYEPEIETPVDDWWIY